MGSQVELLDSTILFVAGGGESSHQDIPCLVREYPRGEYKDGIWIAEPWGREGGIER